MSVCTFDEKNISELELFQKQAGRMGNSPICFGQEINIALTDEALFMIYRATKQTIPHIDQMFDDAAVQIVSADEVFDKYQIRAEAYLFKMCVAHWMDIVTTAIINAQELGDDRLFRMIIFMFNSVCELANLDMKELHNLTVSWGKNVQP